MTDLQTLLEMERTLRAQGIGLVCGLDEAGRGPLAGPVYAAAVILPEDPKLPGLNDSKKLTEKKREALFDLICSEAVSYGIGFATEKEIDKINILNAVYLAMNRAVEQMAIKPDLLLVDGNRNAGINGESRCVIKGDAVCACIAAASVLAKVSRDRFMLEMDKKYPMYAFGQHKGYGTALHYEKLREFGPCDIHRMSFLKKMH